MKKFLFITMAIMLFVISVIPVSYAAELGSYTPLDFESFEEEYGKPVDGYVVLDWIYNNNYFASGFLLFNESGSGDFEGLRNVGAGQYTVSLKDSNDNDLRFTIIQYSFADNKWTKGNTLTVSNPYVIGGITDTFQDSTFNVYNEDGTIFFQPPPTEVTLAEAIQMVVEQEIPATKEIIQIQMKTILLCGIGCLALLISLALLVKVLRNYLAR